MVGGGQAPHKHQGAHGVLQEEGGGCRKLQGQSEPGWPRGSECVGCGEGTEVGAGIMAGMEAVHLQKDIQKSSGAKSNAQGPGRWKELLATAKQPTSQACPQTLVPSPVCLT